MEKPTSVKFTDFEIPVGSLFRASKYGPMSTSWVRTQFSIPDVFEAPKSIESWLRENCPGEWASYHYTSPKGKGGECVMVVRFADKNDALMFKLRGGHQAFENT